MLVPAERVHAQISVVLSAWGMAPDLVATAADVMTDTDLAGVDSHGLSMLMTYEDMWRKGQVSLNARPEVVRHNAATALVDAHDGLGHPVSVFAMKLAIEKAKALGVGLVAVKNSSHFGAAGYYAMLAPPEGLIGFVTTTARSISVAPTRSAVPVLGTNPIAFAAPAGRHRPLLVDISTATVAANKVKVYDFTGTPIPAGWVIDEAGEPVTDPALALEYIFRRGVGGLTPLGGAEAMSSHKGYGLGLMVQVLSATLSGAAFPPIRARGQAPGDPDNVGHFFMAINPDAFREEGSFEADMEAMVDALREVRAADPARPVLIPGDPETRSRIKRGTEGVPVPSALAEKIKAVCDRSGAPFLLT
jgi:LDH2 family malate/lactate/ureidoglycolate dehydrogenase